MFWGWNLIKVSRRRSDGGTVTQQVIWWTDVTCWWRSVSDLLEWLCSVFQQLKLQRENLSRQLTNQRPACRVWLPPDATTAAAQASFPQIKITTTADERQDASISRPVYSTLSGVSTKSHTPTHTHTLSRSLHSQTPEPTWALQSALTQTELPVGGSGPVLARVQTWESSRWANTTNFYK